MASCCNCAEEDYSTAAVVAGAADWQIILRHLLPGFMSYLIVTLTLAIPGDDPGRDRAGSFLGIGLKPPGGELGRAAAGRPERAHRGPVPVAAAAPGCSSSSPCWRSTSWATAPATPPTPTADPFRTLRGRALRSVRSHPRSARRILSSGHVARHSSRRSGFRNRLQEVGQTVRHVDDQVQSGAKTHRTVSGTRLRPAGRARWSVARSRRGIPRAAWHRRTGRSRPCRSELARCRLR